MKQLLLTIAVIVLLLLAPLRGVSAHTLKIDKNIGVILHIDPDDAPVAQEESKLFVEIEDKTGRFNVANPENCDCRATIVEKGIMRKELPVTTGGAYNQLRYTFPTGGVYHVIITGKPNGKGLPFQQFQGDFEYFVKPGKNETQTQSSLENPLRAWVPYIYAIAGSAVVLLFVL